MKQTVANCYKIALKEKPIATKGSDHRTSSFVAHTAKIVTRILRRKDRRETEDILGEDEFRFRRPRGCRK